MHLSASLAELILWLRPALASLPDCLAAAPRRTVVCVISSRVYTAPHSVLTPCCTSDGGAAHRAQKPPSPPPLPLPDYHQTPTMHPARSLAALTGDVAVGRRPGPSDRRSLAQMSCRAECRLTKNIRGGGV